jgi:hypothetical protein
MEVWVSKGFLVLAQNTDTVDYVQQAYALALSIKLTQSSITDISIITNDIVPPEYASVFDQIIPIPYFNKDVSSSFKTEHRYQMFYATPYKETIVLDTDMIMLDDIDSWWNYCKNYDLKFCNRIKNYKMETVVDTVHRKTFIENNLTNPYFALHYFKKTEPAREFYKVLEFVCNNWEWCWTKFAPNYYQNWPSMDLATAIAIEIFGSHEQVLDVSNPMEFVHMKVPLQNWSIDKSSWKECVLYNFTGELTVGNIKQQKLFHYVEKDFLSSDIIDKLKEVLGE